MNSGRIERETLRMSTRMDQRSGDADGDTIELRALGRVFRARWKILFGSTLLAAILAFFLTALVPSSYTASAKLLLDTRKAQLFADSEIFADLDPSAQVINGEVAILRSNLLLEDVIGVLGMDQFAAFEVAAPDGTALSQARATQELISHIRENLSVYPEGESYVIVVDFTAPDPELAFAVTNAIVERYIAQQVEGRRDSVRQAAVWLEERLLGLEAEVALKEEAIATARTDSLLTNGGALENAAQQVNTLNNQLVIASAERLTAEAQVQQLDRLLAEDNIDEATAVVSSPAIEALRTQQLELRKQDAVWADTVGPEHPRRAPILRDLARVEAEIAAEVLTVREVRRSEAEVARFRELSLQESILQMGERVLQISRGEIGLRQLEREASAARQTYEALLARLTETRTQQQLQKADARVIEKATVPTGPSAPRPKLMAAFAATVTLSLVAVAIFFNEMTTTTFRSSQDVWKETGLPLVAALPAGKWRALKGQLKALQKDLYSPYAERIRRLRTKVLMENDRFISTSVMILSSVPDEGKTATAIGLAEMVARSGKSVIVVDCDLRRSSLHGAYRWKMKHDFADYITAACTLSEAIHSPQDLSFDVLVSAGPRPDVADDLSKLLLKEMVDELKTVYDLVVIDGPALLAVSDAMTIAAAVDTRLYLIEYNKTERRLVREGLTTLHDMGLRVEGVILNKAPLGKGENYYGHP